MEKSLILIVEDEPSIADSLSYALRTEGFNVLHCLDGTSGLEALQTKAPALVLLDVGLPDMSGFDWCREVRKTDDVPIVFLTARSEEIDRIVGLEIGADDYVAKPFSPREVSARVRAILRRGRLQRSDESGAGETTGPALEIDLEACRVTYRGKPLELTRYEYRLLVALGRRPGRVFSRSDLMVAAWEDPGASMDRTVDAHIKLLRTKLREIDPGQSPIKTHRGLGYSWSVEP
ncbi:MAG: beta-lactam response regulator transcription factor BlrA [Synoicihabitans sp.]